MCSFGTMLGDQQSYGFSTIKGHYEDCVILLSSHVHKPWLASSCIPLCKQQHVVISFFTTLCTHIPHIALKHDHTPLMNGSRHAPDVLFEVTP
jgi:hypothetical protein